MHMLVRPLIAIFLLLSCDGPAPDADAGRPLDPSLSIGTGEGRFSSFEDNDTLDLLAGCQGAQHVWVALRATGLDPRGTIIDLSLRRASDDVVVSSAFRVRVSMDPVPGMEGHFEVYGLTAVVPEPDEALGQDLLLSVRVTDRADVEVFDERPIRIDWGVGGCR